jgi:hypothetical protein
VVSGTYVIDADGNATTVGGPVSMTGPGWAIDIATLVNRRTR